MSGKQKHFEGTDYMGRILLSLNLVPHERPEKAVTYLVGYNEPPTAEYVLRVDLYNLVLPKRHSQVWVSAKVGITEQRSEALFPSKKSRAGAQASLLEQHEFEVRERDSMLEEVSLHLPSDLKQVGSPGARRFPEPLRQNHLRGKTPRVHAHPRHRQKSARTLARVVQVPGVRRG